MRHNVVLTIMSLLSILLLTFHLTEDIQSGAAPRGISNMIGVLILVVWLYGTLVLAGRRSGFIIILLGSLLGAGVPVIHMLGAGIAKSHEAFFVWTLLAVGATAIFSVILAAQGLWGLRRGRRE
jgi:hypothetical protein